MRRTAVIVFGFVVVLAAAEARAEAVGGGRLETLPARTRAQAAVGPAIFTVAGGTRVSEIAYPWAASMGNDECSGVLIARTRVLTSSSCADLAEGERVRIGGVRRRATRVAIAPGAVRQLIRGPRRDCGGAYEDLSCTPDAAIVRLSAPITSAAPPRLSPAHPGRRAVVVGIGTASMDDDGTRPAHLRAAALQLMADARCVTRYRRLGRRYAVRVAPRFNVCARDTQPPRVAGICTGDGGAPLVARRGSAWLLFGVGSWSASCGERGEPSVFVDTWRLRRFVRRQAPVWRPLTGGSTHISGRVRVGETLTCHLPRFRGRVDSVIYLFQDRYEDALQRGPDPAYVVQHRDRRGAVSCEAYAVNQGGVARAVAGNEREIP